MRSLPITIEPSRALVRTHGCCRRRLSHQTRLLLLLLSAGYVARSCERIWRALVADLPYIPLGVELHYGEDSIEPYTVVALGDSTAQGIGANSPQDSFGAMVARALAEERGAVRLVNLGLDGAKAWHVLDEHIPRLAGLDPDLVLLSVGANDVTNWTPISRYMHQMATILDRLDDTGAQVMVLSVPAIVAVPVLPLPARLVLDVRTHRFNRGLRVLVEDRGNASFVPIYEATRRPFRRDDSNFSADLHHPSSKGYGLWARVILEELAATVLLQGSGR